MKTFPRFLAFGLLALLFLLSPPAAAQQAAPQGSAVDSSAALSADEVQLFQELQGTIEGRVSIPDKRAGTLIQPAGKDWRDFWRSQSKVLGGVVILGMLAVIVLFFLIRGRIEIEGGRSGEKITRFNGVERFAHWLTASSFIVLAISGLNIAYGRELLLPLIGPESFSSFSAAGKLAHNYISFAFALGVLLMLVLWVKDNIPSRLDLEWLKAGGGIVGRRHAHARRFNAGQKLIFWSVVLGGIVISVSGYLLMFPFTVTDLAGMQTAQMVHSVVSVILVAIIIAHIYIGSLGMEGAFEAMGSGEVDLNWAEAHHDLWAEEMRARDAVRPADNHAAVPAE